MGPVCRRYISLLRMALDPAEAGRGLYFSYGADVTLTQQRWAEAQADSKKAGRPLGARAEPRFLWNRHLMAPFTGAPRHHTHPQHWLCRVIGPSPDLLCVNQSCILSLWRGLHPGLALVAAFSSRPREAAFADRRVSHMAIWSPRGVPAC